MNYKIKNTLKKSKNIFIILAILWIVLSIVFVSPISVSIVEAKTEGVFNLKKFTDNLFSVMGDITENLSKNFQSEYIGTFFKAQGYLIIALFFCALIGFIRAMPKNEYTDIEHGSSDWADGEQYRVLNKKKGILLAEKHYLPVDKRGNVNVLVVGRIRFSENLHHMLFQMHINF